MKHGPLFLAIVAVVAVAIWYDFSPRFPINQGLDLRGGMRVVLEVDRQNIPPGVTLNAATAATVRQILSERVNAFGVSGADVRARGVDQFVIEVPATQPKLVTSDGGEFSIKPGANVIGSKQGSDIVINEKSVKAKQATLAFKGDSATITAEDEGVQVNGEPLAKGQTKEVASGARVQLGDFRTSLELPTQAVETVSQLKRVARLEFVHLKNIKTQKNPLGRYSMTPETAPDGHGEIYKFTDTATNKDVPEEQVLKEGEVVIDGSDLEPDSKQNLDPTSRGIVVEFHLKGKASSRFADFTRENVGEHMAIVLDRKVISAPTINSAITQGRGQIEGGFDTLREARYLAQLLNAGALPVPLKEAYTSQVGATLGKDSIDRSIRAGLVGLAAVMLFMIAYYLLPGVLANIALLCYAALTFAIFKLLHVVLDLPGITGFILSVGMAVDANVLIFERVKEEMRDGKTLHAAIDAGFKRAFTSIFDSNMTTWIVCGILIWLGSPMIRGFAVTLALGVAVSMFTAITVTRTMLHLVVNNDWARRPGLFGLNRSWLSRRFASDRPLLVWEKRRVYWGLSLLLMAVSIACIGAGGVKPGIDFTGGTEMRFRFPRAVPNEEVRQTLAGTELKEIAVQQVTDARLGGVVMVRTEPLETAKQEQVKQALAGKGGEFLGTETIGPSVANEVAVNAFLAVLASSLAIVLYLAFRFAMGGFVKGLKYGACAVIALLHNVIAVTGLFALMGFIAQWRIDSLFVTAILTIIGFTVHDTIVVYDRIRENLRNRQRGETLEQIANRSITQTFDRSINTVMTVILVLAALLLWGGSATKLFNIALLAGIAVGTYSSIFVASPLVILWERLAAAKAVPAGRSATDVGFARTRARQTTPSPAPVTAGVGATAPRNGESPLREAPPESATARATATKPATGTIKPKRKRRM